MDADLPLAEPPPGVVPAPHHPAPLQTAMIVVETITTILSTLLLVIRLYTSICLVQKVGWDLLFIILAWMTALGFFVAIATMIPFGLGRHYWDLTLSQVPPYMSKVAPVAVLYIWPLAHAKLSLLIVYHRINPEMVFKYCIYLVGAIILVPTIVYTVLTLGPCNPGVNVEGIQCIHDLGVGQAVTNIGTDIILIVMPLFMVRGLNVSRRKKVVVGCLMGFGSSVVTFSIIRTAFLQAFIHDPDYTYHHGMLILTSILEVNFGVICACLPLLQPFLKRHIPRLALRISDTSRDNERDNRWRNERALQAGRLGGELDLNTFRARFSARLWRMDTAGVGDDGRGEYLLCNSVGKIGGRHDSVLSVETDESLDAVRVEENDDIADRRRAEEGRGRPLLPDPTLVLQRRDIDDDRQGRST